MKRSSRLSHSSILLVVAAALCATTEACSSGEAIAPLGTQRQAVKSVPVPDNVAAWFAAIYGADATDIVAYKRNDLKDTAQALHRVKAVRKSDQQPVGACFDATGNLLGDCGYGLRLAEEKRERDLNGAADDELRGHVAAKAATELTDVGLWLKVTYTYPNKEELLADPAKAAAAAAEQDALVAEARTKFLSELPAGLAKRFSFPPKGPVAYAALNASEIDAVSRLNSVAVASLQKKNEPTATTYKSSIGAANTGYDGTNVPVCVMEGNQPPLPNSLTFAGRYCATGTTNWHARWVGGIVKLGIAPNGIASGSTLYMASWNGCDNNAAGAIAYCASNASIWNFSATCNTTDDRLFDYYAKTSPYAFSALSAGNRQCGTARVTPNCMAYNALIVGGSSENGTIGRGDDTIACANRDLNPGGDREVPHLVAPATAISTDDTADGVSAAAPMVAGAAAQLRQRNSSLGPWPEAMRSILMASATESVDGGPLNLHDSVDDADGAGEVSVADALLVGDATRKVDGGNVASYAGHDYGTMSSSSTPAGSWYSETYTAKSSSWHRLRVVLSWDATATCTNPGDPARVLCNGQTIDGDLDLYVYRKSDGALMASSTTSDNTFEFVEFDVTPNVEYEIKLRAYSWNSTSTYFGLAWYATNHSTS